MTRRAAKLSLVSPALDPVRFSRLRLIDESPQHYADGTVTETSPMRKGSALHSYLLGGTRKVVTYPGRRAGKAWDAFKIEHEGQLILSATELEGVACMRTAIEKHPRAIELLDDGVQETRITWTDHGRACAGTPDVVKPKRGRKRLVELKACHNVKPDKFRWHLDDLHYHAQLDWYANGLDHCSAYEPGPVDEVYIVAVGMRAPYPVVVYRIAESKLLQGRLRWQGWLAQLLECERTGRFPGYVDTDAVIDIEDEGPDGLGLDWAAAK